MSGSVPVPARTSRPPIPIQNGTVRFGAVKRIGRRSSTDPFGTLDGNRSESGSKDREKHGGQAKSRTGRPKSRTGRSGATNARPVPESDTLGPGFGPVPPRFQRARADPATIMPQCNRKCLQLRHLQLACHAECGPPRRRPGPPRGGSHAPESSNDPLDSSGVGFRHFTAPFRTAAGQYRTVPFRPVSDSDSLGF